MTGSISEKSITRTAVVVVHGMGSQKPMETVRGFMRALWTSNPAVVGNEKNIWLIPGGLKDNFDVASGVTQSVDMRRRGREGERIFEFHELYWADLLTDTKPVAVLIFLFELFRKGLSCDRILQPYWKAAAFALALLALSATTLSLFIFDQYILRKIFTAEGGYLHYSILLLNMSIPLAVLWLAAGKPGLQVGLATCAGIAIFFFALKPAAWLVGWPIGFRIEDFVWSANHSVAVLLSLLMISGYLILDHFFLTPYLGDVARYFRNTPGNVSGRIAIRKRGVDLIRRLTETKKYDRIVLVGHSLGSVIAYDILRILFAEKRAEITKVARAPHIKSLIEEVEALCIDPRAKKPEQVQTWRDEWHGSVRKLCAAISSSEKSPWKVTDFVTMGSPLAHAAYLLTRQSSESVSIRDFMGRQGAKMHAPDYAESASLPGSLKADSINEELKKRIEEREFPACPPSCSNPVEVMRFHRQDSQWHIHHGAVFGFVRWSNLYFRAGGILANDFIGGRIPAALGGGVNNIKLSNEVTGSQYWFAHNWYWEAPHKGDSNADHLVELRRAINLFDV